MKKIHFPFAVLIALVLPLVALGETDTVDGIVWTYTVSDGTASLGGGEEWWDEGGYYHGQAVPTSTIGAIAIPSSLGGYPVRSIGEWAFLDCGGLTSVTIPDSVTSIGYEAFLGCSGLTSVTIGNGVTRIGDSAFRYCSGLTSVTIPDSVTSIGNSAFDKCSGLTSVTIGNGVTSIGGSAFINCSGLTSVHIHDLAAWCRIKFENSTSNPLEYAHHFYLDGEELVDLTIPDSVTSISEGAFSGCSGLMSVTIPDSVTSIGDEAFEGCRGLTSVTILGNVTNDWSSASAPFNGCTNLATLVLGEKMTKIGDYMFSGCSGLTSVTIPDSVTSIGSYAFNGCNNLREIVFCGPIPEGLSNSGLPLGSASCIRFPEAYGVEWIQMLLSLQANPISIKAQMRATDPTILDVVYRVLSSNATVNVRALAFEDGERSFAKVVRPETFVEGTGANLGDGIAANVEHTVSWRVSADWAVDLVKVSFEILVSDVGQLPLELVTIPAAGSNAEMTINVWRPREDDLFNALLWHYADHAEDLTVSNGALKQGSTILANGASLANSSAACGYVYGKMGYDLLTGNALTYARSATRWSLATTTKCQYGVLRATGE